MAQVHEPAGALDGESRLALAAVAEEGQPALVAQPPLDGQQLAGAADEAVARRIRQLSLGHGALRREVSRVGVPGLQETHVARVLLEEHGDEPILQP